MKTLVYLLALALDLIGVTFAIICIIGLINGDWATAKHGFFVFSVISFLACMSCNKDFNRNFKRSMNQALSVGIFGIIPAIIVLVCYGIGAGIAGIFLIPCCIAMHLKGLIHSVKF